MVKNTQKEDFLANGSKPVSTDPVSTEGSQTAPTPQVQNPEELNAPIINESNASNPNPQLAAREHMLADGRPVVVPAQKVDAEVAKGVSVQRGDSKKWVLRAREAREGTKYLVVKHGAHPGERPLDADASKATKFDTAQEANDYIMSRGLGSEFYAWQLEEEAPLQKPLAS